MHTHAIACGSKQAHLLLSEGYF